MEPRTRILQIRKFTIRKILSLNKIIPLVHESHYKCHMLPIEEGKIYTCGFTQLGFCQRLCVSFSGFLHQEGCWSSHSHDQESETCASKIKSRYSWDVYRFHKVQSCTSPGSKECVDCWVGPWRNIQIYFLRVYKKIKARWWFTSPGAFP